MAMNSTWHQDITVEGDEAFVLCAVNFLPVANLAILEGVESLESYPV
jgi:hypothetical protein